MEFLHVLSEGRTPAGLEPTRSIRNFPEGSREIIFLLQHNLLAGLFPTISVSSMRRGILARKNASEVPQFWPNHQESLLEISALRVWWTGCIERMDPEELVRRPVSVAWRNLRGDSAARKNAVRASAVCFCPLFSFFFYTIITSTERGASAVENLGSPRCWDELVWLPHHQRMKWTSIWRCKWSTLSFPASLGVKS